MIKKNKQILLTLLISLVMMVFYWQISHLSPNEDFFHFISNFFILASLFLILIKIEFNFNRLLWIAIICRIIFLFSIPELSPDFYRFIWDGELLTNGINPYAFLPSELMENNRWVDNQYMVSLYQNMTDLSKGHYSNYPVLNQLLFFIPTYLFDSIQNNMIALKIMILLADVGVIFILKKILNHLNLSIQKIWLYALNPFIIIEFVGNLHFEGVMIFLLLTSIYFVLKDKTYISATLLGLSIQIKLIPLMLIPFFFKKLKWKKSIVFLIASLAVFSLIGMVLWHNTVYLNNMMESITIYFTTFQFNSSLFSIVNYFKSNQMGWDSTYIVGPMLSKIATVLIILLAVFRNYKSEIDIFKGVLFALVIYYLFATTVHPWYVSMILIMSIFTDYKFGLIWTLLIPLTYSFYAISESVMFFRILEYGLVGVVLVYELIKYWDKKVFGLNFKSFFESN